MSTRTSRWTLLITVALAIVAPRNATAQLQSEPPDEIYPGRYVANCKQAVKSGCVCDSDPQHISVPEYLRMIEWLLQTCTSLKQSERRRSDKAADATIDTEVVNRPVHLACEGTIWMDSANGKTAKDHVMSLAIDQIARTATIDSYAAVRIVTKADNEIMLFMPDLVSVVGVLSGTLSRITGDAWVDVNSLVDGAYKFYGRCEPAKCLSGVCSANMAY
jgi:hypothetical protein